MVFRYRVLSCLRAAVPTGMGGGLLALALGALVPSAISAQNVEDVLGRYRGANAQGFLQPLADVLGAALGSGWARSADIQPGFHLRLSAIAAGSPISSDARTFVGTTEDFDPVTTVEAPTIFGSTETVAVSGVGGTTYRFAGGIDADMAGTVIPQLTIGTVAGTEAMVRWFSVDVGEDFGSVSQLGLGARHDVDQYFRAALPVELAAGIYWQSFDIGDVVEASTFTAMVHTSWSTSVLTLFGGLGYETASVDVSYTPEGETTGIDIALDGANTVRATAGVGLQMWLLGIFADYTVASQGAFTLGVEVGR
jgi:hypothetical protein